MRAIVFFLLTVLSWDVLSQEIDSTFIGTDSTYYYSNKQKTDDKAQPDTISVQARPFETGAVTRLKEDPELQYQVATTVGESLWTRLLRWIGQLIESFFDKATNTNWGKMIIYVVVLAVLVIAIMWILKVNAYKVLSGQGAETFRHNILHENIHAMDFDKLIQEALASNDHRLAVRLVFLYALKMLSDKNLVHWDQGKTNHDYIEELKVDDLKNGFHELNYYFEYAWYGNFRISLDMFTHVHGVFNQWRTKL